MASSIEEIVVGILKPGSPLHQAPHSVLIPPRKQVRNSLKASGQKVTLAYLIARIGHEVSGLPQGKASVT